MSYTWATFKAAVLVQITDRAPNDTNFAACVAEFALARISRDVLGDANGYALRQNRYTSTRRAIAGYVSTLTVDQLKVAAKALMSEGPINDTAFAAACALYIRERIAREVDARSAEDGGQSANAIATACKADYVAARLRLLGFQHTFTTTDALRSEVERHLPVDAIRMDTSDFITVQLNNAIIDLQSFGPWIDNVILTARDDIEVLNARVFQEIRNGVLDLINFIKAYRSGTASTYLLTCSGKLEEQKVPGSLGFTAIDADEVPFDETAAQAVAHYVKAKLLLEWGESLTVAQISAGSYRELRTRLYLRNNQ